MFNTHTRSSVPKSTRTRGTAQNPHVILLGETMLLDEVELRVPNLFVYWFDEVSPRGYPYRGTTALVRRGIVHKELEHAPFSSVRTQRIRVYLDDEELLLYAAYKPPSETFCSTDVQTLFSSLRRTLVVGDLNANSKRFLSGPALTLQEVEPISLSELQRAVFRLPKRKAPGSDGITNAALMPLPIVCLAALTRLFNGILQTGHFPEMWKTGGAMQEPPRAGGTCRYMRT
ncbi:unnamed protein product [Euphydryas editha]|uniref:RNA-directed DNA polymerase from mobile element jockey n=1 Tax=Euphydryas editha TaxID=104508 RepID=A0AAU9UVW8_EUPED|nr:unnamed protein product [Euphydryas editha]